MTTHCSINDSIATVTVTSPVKEKLKFDNPPINVTLNSNSSGNSINIVGDYEQFNSHHPNYFVSWEDPTGNSTDNYSLSFYECGKGGICGASSPNTSGEIYYALHINKNGIDTGNHFNPTGWYSASIANINRDAANLFSLRVVDRLGVILTRNYSQNPEYAVTCNDDCPEGTSKCFSTNYPGYCCLPCNEIKAEIRAITSHVRSLNKE